MKEGRDAVDHDPDFGPCFGGGVSDIRIFNDSNLKSNNYTKFGFSFTPPSGITFGSEQGNAYLAGTKNFKVKEIEVYALN